MSTAESPVKQPIDPTKIPSCIEIGLEASRKGNFQMARQMFRAAMEQLEGQPEMEPRLIEQIINTADTYLNEGRYDSARQWYEKALHRCELHKEPSLQNACLMAKLGEIGVLQSDMNEYQKCFDDLQRVYLLSQDTNTGKLLDALIDLSWALCVQGHTDEIHSVNDLITQIKQLDEEEKLTA